ncbi:DNA primase, partial [Patescibacteria group bacterium]|nr:DNA primase [Patescibacteria group bacterium]
MEPKEEIRARIHVDELIGEYLELRPAGHMNFKALCPFHGEKTPSFHVSREKEIWHCFGCHKGGDIFAFIMEIEGVDFAEAMRILAKKAGVEMPEYKPQKDKGERELYIEMHQLAGRFYKKVLESHESAGVARDYLKNRGITSDLVDKFLLGFALESWESLCLFLKQKGYTEKQILGSGLAKIRKSGSGIIDRFRNRIMIPISDTRGNIVGFTGRLLSGEGPKYLNSPETLIYNKRAILYGLHLAKTAIRQKGSVIIVEGNLDVVASHKAGVENVVA